MKCVVTNHLAGKKILTRYSSKDCIYRPLKMAKVQQ